MNYYNYTRDNILSGKVPYNNYNYVFNIEKLIHNYPIEKCKYSSITSRYLIDSKSIEEYRDKFNVNSCCEAFLEKISKISSNRSEETKEKISKANLGKKRSKESKEKMSKAKSGKNHPLYGKTGEDSHRYGKKLSKEHIEKIRQSHLGKNLSKETREKISKANSNPSEETREKISKANSGENNGMYGKTGEKNPFYGKKHSEETREKIRQASSNPSKETREKMSIGTTNAILNNRDNNPNKIEVYSKSYNENIYAHKGEVFAVEYLDKKNIDYEYESDYFEYIDKNGIKRHYTPDFYLPDFDLYIEVKDNDNYPSKEQINSVINTDNNNLITVQPKHLNNNKYDLYNTLELYRKGILKGYNLVKTKSSIKDLFEIGINIIDKINKFTYSKEISGIINTHNYTTFEDDGFRYCEPNDDNKSYLL